MKMPLDARAKRVPTNGAEYDCLPACRVVVFHRGERQAAKRSYHRRFRRLIRAALRVAESD